MIHHRFSSLGFRSALGASSGAQVASRLRLLSPNAVGLRAGLVTTGPIGVGVFPKVALQVKGAIALSDGITAPSASITNYAILYVDSADGDFKIRFSDGTVKTIVVDT